MDFNLNVNVQIGVTPQLATFLTALLQSRPATPVQLPATEATPPEPAESDKSRRTRRAKSDAPKTAAPVTTTEEVPETPQPAADPKPFAEAPVQQPEKELTEEDIRAAMHRTRQRFEGGDNTPRLHISFRKLTILYKRGRFYGRRNAYRFRPFTHTCQGC